MLVRFLFTVAMLIAHAPLFAAQTSAADDCSTERLLSHGGSFTAASDGVRIWYKLAGREGAPVIAYLHGGPGYNSYTFEKSVGSLLEDKFRVLYLDQRGCGRSTFDGPLERYGMDLTVADIEHLRELIGVDRLVVAGHSFGGAVAAEYATRYPSHTAAVIMIDTMHDLGRALEYQVEYIDSIADTAFASTADGVHAVARSSGDALEKLAKMYESIGRLELQAKLHYADPANQERMEALDRDSGVSNCTAGNTVMAFATDGYLGKALPNVARRLAAPTLLVAGSASHVIGKKNIRSAAEVWGARVEWIDAGHFVYFEKPHEFAQVVEQFLNEGSGDRKLRR